MKHRRGNFGNISPETLRAILGNEADDVLKIVSTSNFKIVEVNMGTKVVGELVSKVPGNGYTDVTIGTTVIRAWDTTKRGNVSVLNPVVAALAGCRIGDTVEADVYEKAGAKGGTFRNLNGIVIQNSPGEAVAGEPLPAANLYPDRASGSTEREYLALAGPVYRMIGEIVGKKDLEYLSENHERISAVANTLIEQAITHLSGLKSVVGE
jgi:hypothetical protein